MRRSFVVCAILAFACLARADVEFGDIVRWGLMRRADVFPGGGATLTSPTSGVLRVIETRRVVDHTRFTLSVVSNLVTALEPEFFTLTNGVYVSSAVQSWNGGSYCSFYVTGGIWTLMYAPEKAGYGDGPLTYQYLFGPEESTGFASTNAWNAFPAVFYGNYPTNAPPAGVATIDYYRYTETVTNDFVSATMLQDVIDDLRQEISEAIESHVQLLH